MTKYEYGIDTAAITALDVHTHVEIDGCGHKSLDDDLISASEKHFKSGQERTPTIDSMAQHFRERAMAAVVFTVDAGSATGHPVNSVEDLVEGAARNNDVLIPFGSVDPWRGKQAVDRVHRLVDDFGVKGFKFHPSLQAFEPNDRTFYPIYEAIAEHGVPALFHTGQTGIGTGLPGGHGIKLRYSDPMLIDDVAADFPDLTVILAHPSVPWQDAAISIATHKPNVHIDLSGWAPKYFPGQLVHAANRMLREKVLYGSGFPLIQPDRWMRDFAALDVKDEVRPLILKDNALRVLGLAR